MAKASSRALTKEHIEGKINGIIVTKNVLNISHQEYANDTILPSESSTNETLNIKSITQQYMEASSQKVNATKSEFFYS